MKKKIEDLKFLINYYKNKLGKETYVKILTQDLLIKEKKLKNEEEKK